MAGGAVQIVLGGAEEVCALVLAVPLALIRRNLDLIGLLDALVALHVRGEGRGQGVVGQLFQDVAGFGAEVADADQRLQRVHQLHDGLQAVALGGIRAVEVGIAAEHAVGSAVVLHQLLPAEAEAALLLEAALEQVDHARGLQAEGQVHALGLVELTVEVGALHALQRLVLLLPQRLAQALPAQGLAHGHGVGEGVEEVRPVDGLLLQLLAQLNQVLLAGDVVQPQRDFHVLRAARHRPLLQRVVSEVLVFVLEEAIHQHQHALVVAGGEVAAQRAQGQHQRPVIVVALGAEPAVLALAGENPLHHAGGAVLVFLVAQRPAQRNDALQIVGRAGEIAVRTALPFAAFVGLGADVGKVPGDALGLGADLVQQPVLRVDGAHRQRREGVRRQRSLVEDRFHLSAPRCLERCLFLGWYLEPFPLAPSRLRASSGLPASKMWYSHSMRPL